MSDYEDIEYWWDQYHGQGDYEYVEDYYDSGENQAGRVLKHKETGELISILNRSLDSWAESSLGDGFAVHKVTGVREKKINVYDLGKKLFEN